MLFDLLTKEEEENDILMLKVVHELRGLTLNKFNTELLTERLIAVSQWVRNKPETKDLRIEYHKTKRKFVSLNEMQLEDADHFLICEFKGYYFEILAN